MSKLRSMLQYRARSSTSLRIDLRPLMRMYKWCRVISFAAYLSLYPSFLVALSELVEAPGRTTAPAVAAYLEAIVAIGSNRVNPAIVLAGIGGALHLVSHPWSDWAWVDLPTCVGFAFGGLAVWLWQRYRRQVQALPKINGTPVLEPRTKVELEQPHKPQRRESWFSAFVQGSFRGLTFCTLAISFMEWEHAHHIEEAKAWLRSHYLPQSSIVLVHDDGNVNR